MKLLSVFCLLLIAFGGLSQKESDKLRAKQRELQKKIKYTKQLIGNTKNKERLTMTELGIINQQIAYRDELISLYGNQLKSVEKQIEENRKRIKQLEEEIVVLKDKYAKLIFFAYKHRNSVKDNSLMWFSGEDINKTYLRMKYLNQIAKYRKLQVELIKKTQIKLAKKEAELQSDIAKKKEILDSKDKEKQQFQNDKDKQKELLTSLRQEENKLKEELDDQEEKKRRLSAAIRRAIEKEIAAQAKKNNSNNKYGSTPEAKLAGKSFAANKGRLPWPVLKGGITGKYGKQAHPVLAGVYTQNNGVDISTSKGAVMRSVFAGKVTSVLIIPGAGKVVMVSHGNYRTVYANLQEIYVSKGDNVSAKQEIGVLLPAEGGATSEAHFEIWKIDGGNMQKQNPSYWLAR